MHIFSCSHFLFIHLFCLGSAFSRIAEYMNTSISTSLSEDKKKQHLMPICMAPCCHSICEWENCFYQPFFTILGFTPHDYSVMAAVSQWASLAASSKSTCTVINDDTSSLSVATAVGEVQTTVHTQSDLRGLILQSDILNTLENIENIENISGEAVKSSNIILGCDDAEETLLMSLCGEEFETNLNRDHKRQLGSVCKEFIDIGRSVGLLAAGYTEIELIRYTHSSVENLLICAGR